ncbi:hypothetical protein BY996DRAFT_6422692 [Phakopsora pachyrhizi]|nr:hypothetical protein BY996DRAFT_6425844 [Phakopsora pachyrhizi]KAI8446337.1 hypothetical protein BY996DRAFT_6422692 [Phakopsora pachyrhizi]
MNHWALMWCAAEVDDPSATGYVNLQKWTDELDQWIESVFEEQLSNVYEVWNYQFSSKKAQVSSRLTNGFGKVKSQLGSKAEIKSQFLTCTQSSKIDELDFQGIGDRLQVNNKFLVFFTRVPLAP